MRTVVRTLASAGAKAGAEEEGPLAVTLPLGVGYRALAERPGGIGATVTVTFTAPGHPTLRQRIAVVFRRARKQHPAKGARRPGSAHRAATGAGR